MPHENEATSSSLRDARPSLPTGRTVTCDEPTRFRASLSTSASRLWRAGRHPLWRQARTRRCRVERALHGEGRRVEYALTHHGWSAAGPLVAVADWAAS